MAPVGRVKHWYRRARTPISMTRGSFRKKVMMGVVNSRPRMPAAVRMTVQVLMEKDRASFIRSIRPAP